MKVLIIGGAGYIGSVLVEYLKEKGEEVTVFDNFTYSEGDIQDVRDLNQLYPSLEKSDAVVNLAGLSNDPLADISPSITWDINYKSNEALTKLLRNSGKRIIYASSCSVYGFSKDEFNEESSLHPVTLYAKLKMLSEEFYLHRDLSSVVLRFATVYGSSPMPRFDLVVNKMIADAHFNKKIEVNGGEQWRPVVHIKDVARAIYITLYQGSGVYNVGSNEQNYQIKDLGKIVSQIANCDLVINEESVDHRSYRVNFDKISSLGFTSRFDIEYAFKEISNDFRTGKIENATDDVYFRVKYLTKRINAISSC